MTSKKNIRWEIKKQTIKCSRISRALRDTRWNLNTKAMRKIYKTYVRPISTYNADTRKETNLVFRMAEMTGYTLRYRKICQYIGDCKIQNQMV